MPLKTMKDEQPSMNLTSMIDVMFLLVIFFMVGTKFSDSERNLSIKVPQVTSTGPLAPAPEKRVINVYQDGRITFDKQPMTLAELKQALAAAKQNYCQLGVVVRGDGSGAYQNVANVLAACREVGINDLGMSVRVAGGESTAPR